MEVRGYVYFKSVPVLTNDTDQDGLSPEEEEWLESVSFLEDDLHWLLRLPHHRFWSQVVFEEDLHKCLESYLTSAPRDYDVIHMKFRPEVKVALEKIHRLVFLIFLRMSTYKETKEHHLRPQAYGEIIYQNFVFDVPKLMDLCVLYGFRNKPILTKMIKNIFSTQPKYIGDLSETCNFALNAFHFAEEKLFLNVPEKHGGCRKLEDNTVTGIKELPLTLFSEIINYICDVCATIFTFLDIYSPACAVFHQNGAITRIVSFYEQTFPPVEKETIRYLKRNESISVIECVKKKIILSKTFLIKMFRNILSYCCIQHILDSNCTQFRTSIIPPSEEFIEIFTDIACEKTFLHDYNELYPFESDMELINETGAYLDPERLSYVFGSIHDNVETQNNTQVYTSTAENGARPKTSKITIPSDEPVKSLHGIAAILKPKQETSEENGVPSSEPKDSRPSAVQMESIITSVQDVLPECSKDFIEVGLDYFNYDPEKLIDSILTDNLPSDLSQLDRNMTRNSNPSLQTENPTSSVLSERRNIFDHDEFDVFNRADVNLKNIHIGKKNKTPNSYQSLQNEEESEFLKHFICTYGDQESDEDEVEINRKLDNLYEDEYDDTYDSTLVGLNEPLLENEPEKDEPSDQTSEETREPRPDDFCVNPEKQRQEYEERRQSKLAARNKGGPPVNQNNNNRQNKERNKAYAGNHNRRKQGDYKKSKGMVPFPSR